MRGFIFGQYIFPRDSGSSAGGGHQHDQQSSPPQGSDRDRNAATGQQGYRTKPDPRLPWHIEDIEHRYGIGQVYHVVDRLGVLVAIFIDPQIAAYVVESVNGSGRIPHEAGGGN